MPERAKEPPKTPPAEQDRKSEEKGTSPYLELGAIFNQNCIKTPSRKSSKIQSRRNMKIDAKRVPKWSPNRCKNTSKNYAKNGIKKGEENHEQSCFSEV